MKRFLVPNERNVRLWRWSFAVLFAVLYLPNYVHGAIAAVGFLFGAYFQRKAQHAIGAHCHMLYEQEQDELNHQLEADAEDQDYDHWPLPFESLRKDEAA